MEGRSRDFLKPDCNQIMMLEAVSDTISACVALNSQNSLFVQKPGFTFTPNRICYRAAVLGFSLQVERDDPTGSRGSSAIVFRRSRHFIGRLGAQLLCVRRS